MTSQAEIAGFGGGTLCSLKSYSIITSCFCSLLYREVFESFKAFFTKEKVQVFGKKKFPHISQTFSYCPLRLQQAISYPAKGKTEPKIEQ